MDSEKILEMRVRKLTMEIESARRRKELGIHPIDVLDDLVSQMLYSMKKALRKEYPNITEKEIREKMRRQMEIYDKKKRKRSNMHGRV